MICDGHSLTFKVNRNPFKFTLKGFVWFYFAWTVTGQKQKQRTN